MATEPPAGSRATRWLATWLLAHPRSVAAVLALILGVCALVLPHLRIISGFEPFFDRNRPEHRTLDRINAHFVSDDIIIVGYEHPDVFSHDALVLLRGLDEQIAAIEIPRPGGGMLRPVEKVTSLATITDVVGEEASFQNLPLVPDPIPRDPVALRAIRTRAEANPLIRESLLAMHGDARHAALMLRLPNGLSDNASAQTVAALQRILAAHAACAPIQFFAGGETVTQVEVARSLQQDLQRFIPFVYLIILVLVFVFVRRIGGVILAVINVTFALAGGVTALTLIGGSINNLSTMLPPVTMVLSLALVIHFFSELGKNLKHHDEATAVHETISGLLVPAFMCELTTAVGFLALAVTSVPAIREFALAAAIAVMLAFTCSFLLVALALRLRPARTYVGQGAAPLSKVFDRWLARYSSLVVRRPWPFLSVALVMVAMMGFGIARVVVDENHIEAFAVDAPTRVAASFVDTQLGGSNMMLIDIESDRDGGFLDPGALHDLEALEADLRADGTTTVISPVAAIKLMHRAFADGDPASFRIPDTREQVAQLLLLNGDDTLYELIDRPSREVRLIVRDSRHSSAALGTRFGELEAVLARRFPSTRGYTSHASGQPRLWWQLSRDIVGSQTNSLGISFLVIFVPIFIVFRSFRAGLYSIPSNVFPVICTFGLMGWMHVPLNSATAMIASIVLGIAVDDTLHFVEHMRARLRVHGNLEAAISETLATKGSGAVWITIIITLGFLVLVVSSFQPTRQFGALTASAMITGLVGELLLLPPLMLVMRTKLGIRTRPPAG